MKYQFKNYHEKECFAKKGTIINQELADKIGMNRFEVRDSWVYVDGMNIKIHIPRTHLDMVMHDIQVFCFEIVESKKELQEMNDEETRESKFKRLIAIIEGDDADRDANGEIVISKDFAIKLISDHQDGDSVEAIIDGRYYQDMFNYHETQAIHQADKNYQRRREIEFKHGLFMSRDF